MTVQKLCTVLNSKRPPTRHLPARASRDFFFCSLSMDPCVTFQGSLALLLVAFALEKVQKSAEESEDQIDQILAVLPPRGRKTKLIKFLGSGLVLRGE